MAVIMMDGFDTYNGSQANIGLLAAWRSADTGSAMVAGRFGGQALRIENGSNYSGQETRYYVRDLPDVYSSIAVGFAHRQHTDSGVTDHTSGLSLLQLCTGGDTESQCGIAMTPDGRIQAVRTGAHFYQPGTVLGASAPGVILHQTWQYIEAEFVVGGFSGSIRIWVDGVEALNVTGANTKGNVGDGCDRLMFFPNLTNQFGANSNLIDDLYVTDDSRLGERKIETIYPTADTAQKQWSPLTGSSNYAMVNESVANGDTNYLQSSTTGNLDHYAMGDLSTNPSTVDAVQLVAFARKTDAATREINLSINSGGTTSNGPDRTLSQDYRRIERVMATNPVTGGPWTAAAVNGLLAGPRVAS